MTDINTLMYTEGIEDMLEVLERRSKESASEYVRRVLEYNIVHMRLLPGEQLQEKALAEALNVSRTPIREAILELKRRNIIDIYPQHGTFVSYLDNGYSDDIRYLRYVFEAELMAKACEIRDREIIDRMYENLQLQKLYIWRDRDRFLTLDDEFHGAIYSMCGRDFIYQVVRESSLHFDRMRLISYDLDSARELIDEHAAMIEVIETADAQRARALCQRHLTRALSDYDRIKRMYPQYFKPEKG